MDADPTHEPTGRDAARDALRPEAVGARLRTLRRGRSVRKFSRELGLHRESVRRCMLGEKHPSIEVLAALAEREQVDLDWLAYGDAARQRTGAGEVVDDGVAPVATASLEEFCAALRARLGERAARR